MAQETKNDEAHTIRVSSRAYQELVRRQMARLKEEGARPSLIDLVDEALFSEKR